MQMFRRKGKPVSECTRKELRFSSLALEIDQDGDGASRLKRILEERRATPEEMRKVLALIRREVGQHEPPTDAQLASIVASIEAAKAIEETLAKQRKGRP